MISSKNIEDGTIGLKNEYKMIGLKSNADRLIGLKNIEDIMISLKNIEDRMKGLRNIENSQCLKNIEDRIKCFAEGKRNQRVPLGLGQSLALHSKSLSSEKKSIINSYC